MDPITGAGAQFHTALALISACALVLMELCGWKHDPNGIICKRITAP